MCELAALLVLQFVLGISNVLLRLPTWSRVLYLLVAGLTWSGMVMLHRGSQLQRK